MVGADVEIAGAHGALLPAYAALPADARRGVVVIHEIYGRAPEIDRVVDRLAGLGYAAVAPDLFSEGPKLWCIAKAVRDLSRGEGPAVDKVRAARDWLTAQTGVPSERIAVIGFCFGGGFALAVAGDFGAVSTNYGAPPRKFGVSRTTGQPESLPPIIGCYGGRDHSMSWVPPRLERALTERGVPHQIHVAPTVGHSFLTDGDRPLVYTLTTPLLHIRYDAEVAEDAWRKIHVFFDEHLPA